MQIITMNERVRQKTIMLSFMPNGIGMEEVLTHGRPVIKTVQGINNNQCQKGVGNHFLCIAVYRTMIMQITVKILVDNTVPEINEGNQTDSHQ